MALHGDVDPRRDQAPSPAGSLRWFTLATGAESLGDSLTRTLLPIVAVTVLGAGTVTVGVINSLGLLAFLFLSLPLGALADRWSTPTAIMTTSTLARAAAALTAVAAWIAGWLDGSPGLVILVLMALVVGVADVGYATGQGLLVPRLVEPAGMRAAFGQVQSASQIGAALGPALLSGALTLVAAPVAWIGAGATYLLSGGAQRRIRPAPRTAPAPGRTAVWAGARSGVRHVLRQPTLCRITVANTLSNAAVMAANTLLPVLALTHLGVPPATYAAIGAIGAVSGVAGAASGSRLTSTFGLRTTRLAVSAGISVGIVLVMLAGVVAPVLPGAPELWLAVESGLAGFCASVAMVSGADLAPRLAPPDTLGSVMGAQRTLTLGAMPVSALTIGALGATIGLVPTTYIWLALALTSAIPCLTLRDPDEATR